MELKPTEVLKVPRFALGQAQKVGIVVLEKAFNSPRLGEKLQREHETARRLQAAIDERIKASTGRTVPESIEVTPPAQIDLRDTPGKTIDLRDEVIIAPQETHTH